MDNELESIIKEGIKQLVEYGLLGRSEYAIVLMPSRLVQSRNPIIGLYYPNDILADTEIVEKEYSIDNIKEKL